MQQNPLRSPLLPAALLIGALLGFGGAGGCHSTSAPAGDPTTRPVTAQDALAYLQSAVKDDSRRIEAYQDVIGKAVGELDNTGRRSLESQLPKWFAHASAQHLSTTQPFRVTPNFGITIYEHGSALPSGPAGVVAQIQIYKYRHFTRILILDPAAPRLVEYAFVLPTTDPQAWIERLFAGKL